MSRRSYSAPVRERILRVVHESPGIPFELLATRIGVRARNSNGHLNTALSQTLSCLEKDKQIERRYSEHSKAHEPPRIYPAGYVARQKRPLFQKANPPPCIVRQALPGELDQPQRKPTVRALQREPIPINMGTQHQHQLQALETALKKYISLGQEFTVGHICREANFVSNQLTKFPELATRIREAARDSQESAKLDRIVRVETALDAAVQSGKSFTKASIARAANVDVNFIDAIPELKEKIREATQNGSEPEPVHEPVNSIEIASAAESEELRYQLDRLKQQLNDSNDRNRELRQQLAQAQEQRPKIFQSPLDAFRLGLATHEETLKELHDRASRLSNHLEMLNEQIAQEEATISHYQTLLEIESRAIPSPSNGNSKKVEIAT